MVVSRTDSDDGRQSTFIVTVLNVGSSDQVLYTPGFVGPSLWPRTPFKGEPLDAYMPARRGEQSVKDFITLRPGEGFSRSSDTLSARQLESISKVGAHFLIYGNGFEGHSNHVVDVINAPFLSVDAANHGKGSG